MSKPGHRGQFRIIGGRHRARRLRFVERPGLRPTPDRVRETLFNWLSMDVVDARGLDLFAGSGALGLEALSRGAGQVVFVDSDAAAVRRIAEHLTTLGAESGRAWTGDWQHYLRQHAASGEAPFDLVFADPPFASDYLPQLCTLLAQSAVIKPSCRLYVEFDRATPFVPPVPWAVHREGRAGQVCYALLTMSQDEKDDAKE
ncbi:MAG: 16S rRNA (guanine(966)-N(2))-methyltransferase RsmD [Gammaproteobacteria bacterium]